MPMHPPCSLSLSGEASYQLTAVTTLPVQLMSFKSGIVRCLGARNCFHIIIKQSINQVIKLFMKLLRFAGINLSEIKELELKTDFYTAFFRHIRI